nr:dienelactone hydrolase family protein [Allosphingosinicella vermicomposti]
MIEIETLDGHERFNAYLSQPHGTPRGAIVVIQEIFGVNEGIRCKCDSWASQGYVAIAPDLFWRLEPGVELDADIPEEFKHALNLMSQFDQDGAIRDIEATIRAARTRLSSRGKVGIVGYCLGGRLAYMAAARTDVDASVGYYAVGLDDLLDESHAIAKPLLLHIAGADHFVDVQTQKKMHEALDNHPRVTLIDYPAEDHGFAAEIGKRRSEEAAQRADGHTRAFFSEHLN